MEPSAAPNNGDDRESRLRRKLLGELGQLVRDALDDDSVTEVQLNPDGGLWTDGSEGRRRIGEMQRLSARNLANTMAACLDSLVNHDSPMLEGELGILSGERLTLLVPPLVTATSFALRKHIGSKLTLADWADRGGMDDEQKTQLVTALADRRNIIVSGSTGSGKTTFANALLAELSEVSPNHRIVVIEDTRELQVAVPNVISMCTSEGVGMDQLLRKALRLTPDRIVVGEVRGAEALTMLESWNTGHPGGICTVHASSAQKARTRIEHACADSNRSEGLIRAAYDAAVDVIVQLERVRDGRRIVADILDNGMRHDAAGA